MWHWWYLGGQTLFSQLIYKSSECRQFVKYAKQKTASKRFPFFTSAIEYCRKLSGRRTQDDYITD
jgi:hypothetical protein